VHQDYGTAGDALLNAIEREPDNPHARFHLALLHVLVGAPDQARQSLDQLVAEGGDCADDARVVLSQWFGDRR
jgi:hypothetical protein